MEEQSRNVAGIPADPGYLLDKSPGTRKGQEALLLQLPKKWQ